MILVKNYQHLGWDSNFFGFGVARILPARLGTRALQGILRELREANVALAYWAADPNDRDSGQAAVECMGFLADRKITFSVDSEVLHKNMPLIAANAQVEEFCAEGPTAELEALAIQAGEFSRFRVDPRIPPGRFIELYRQWIRKSVNGELAEKVYVVRSEVGKILGMVTVGEKNGRGDIGLLAVDRLARGRNLGLALVSAAQEWSLKKGLPAAQVVTQVDNVAACRFYEKCGYHIDKVEHIYHFWS